MSYNFLVAAKQIHVRNPFILEFIYFFNDQVAHFPCNNRGHFFQELSKAAANVVFVTDRIKKTFLNWVKSFLSKSFYEH